MSKLIESLESQIAILDKTDQEREEKIASQAGEMEKLRNLLVEERKEKA